MPLFVEDIISSIESRGLEMDGIYRISGNLSEVQKLRNQVDHGKLEVEIMFYKFSTYSEDIF